MYSNGNGKSSTTLEREAEQTRAQLSATLDELRHSMSPGQMLDQFVDYAKDTGGADFMRNLGQQVKTNPLPVTLIGAGIAWLMMSSARGNALPYARRVRPYDGSDVGAAGSGMGQGVKDAAGSMSDAMRGAADTVSGGVRSAGSGLSSAASSVSQAASQAGSTISDAASSASGAVSQAASAMQRGAHDVHDAMSSVGSRVADSGYTAGASIVHAFRDQPLLFGAVGLAIGAAIGAALPRTQTEDQYVGPASDSVKEQAQEVASEQYAHMREAADNTIEKVKSEAERQGLTNDGLGNMAAKAGAVADTAMKTAQKEVSKASDSFSAPTEKRTDGSDASEKKERWAARGKREDSGFQTGASAGTSRNMSRPDPSEIT